MLNYINRNRVTLEDLEAFHGGTLGSLMSPTRRYLIKGVPHGKKTLVFLNDDGREDLAAYTGSRLRERVLPGELTERCQQMLRVVRILRGDK
jgi:hypothetical protein